MNKYNPNIHHRRSIRLKGYDYSQAGLYFVTICTKNRHCLFGEIINGELILNNAGKMIEKWYFELENKFPDIKCGEMVVMPNHFHCIIHNVGADLCVCPNTNTNHSPLGEQSPSAAPVLGEQSPSAAPILGEQSPSAAPVLGAPVLAAPVLGEHIGSPLHVVLQWFKTMTTNEYIRGVKTLGWQPFDGKLWQRNYWEHIIRNETSHHNIANYIIANPLKWDTDNLNQNNG